MEQLEELLSCAICLDRFKQPKLLPCQHTFCLKPCLEGLVQGQSVNCPICRLSHTLPSNGVGGFPANLTIANLLDLPKQTDAPGNFSCQECSRTGGLFGNCCHCGRLLCSACISNHLQNLKDEVEESISKVRNRSTTFSQNVYVVDELLDRLVKNETKVIKDIEEWYEQCMSALQSKKSQLFDRVRTFTNCQKRNLEEKRESSLVEVELMKNFCENAEEQARSLSTKGAELNPLIDVIQKSKNFEASDEDIRTEKYVKVCEEEAGRILKSITEFGGIDISERAIARKIEEDRENGERTEGKPAWFSTTDDSEAEVATTSDTNKSSLHEYRNKGRVKRCFGREGSGPGCLRYPAGIAVTPDDEIVVADCYNSRIQIFDPSGNFVRVFGKDGEADGEFKFPWDVCVTGSNQIVVADKSNNRIQVFTNDGIFLASFGKDILEYPSSVDANDEGLVFVGDNSNRIKVFSLSGNLIRTFGDSWLDSQDMSKYLAVSHTDKKVIVSEWAKCRIGVFDESDQLILEFRTEGSSKAPFRVSSDRDGNIIGCDGGNNTIQVFDKDGFLISRFGSKGSEPGRMLRPRGVAILGTRDIVISDTDNKRIQIF